jgi:4-amino-4-deoxy-L-arabinose transferase-like glycosyltransferase
MLEEHTNQTAPKGSTHWMLLGICVALFIALRIRWVGHLLVWDEAMTLCTVRSLVSGGHDYFSHWFWRHPPLFTVLMTLLRPLESGFAQRTECMAIGFGLINLLLLFRLNYRLFGQAVALWSVFFISVMPGAVFFDTWVKTDHPVTTFGLLAFLCLVENRTLLAGLSLGVALLSKETAVFYVMAAVLIYLAKPSGQRSAVGVFFLTLTPVLTCGWWYFIFAGESGVQVSVLSGSLLEHLHFGVGTETGFAAPWNYYLRQLPTDLGSTGLLFSAAGAIVLTLAAMKDKYRGDIQDYATRRILGIWPLFLLVPSYVLVSVLTSKVPWIVMVLLPAWATLQGVAMSGCIDLAKDRFCVLPSVLAFFIIAIACLPLIGRDYETMLRNIDASQWRGAMYSRQAAQAMNGLVKDGDRILITSFHYWKGLGPGDPCAVFAYYFTKKAEVFMRPHEARFDLLLDDIRRYRIDWALLSPEPGKEEHELFDGFMGKLGLRPYKLDNACIFKTAGLCEQYKQ